MRNLLRSLMLAVFLVPALAAVPPAQAVSAPQLEACVNGGTCSLSGTDCVIRGNCPSGETCICNN
jgi:hypothetical protein